MVLGSGVRACALRIRVFCCVSLALFPLERLAHESASPSQRCIRPSPGALSRSRLPPREALPGGLCHERWSTVLFVFSRDEPLATVHPLKPMSPQGMSTIKLGPQGLWEVEREGTHKLGLLEALAGEAQLVDGCVPDG